MGRVEFMIRVCIRSKRSLLTATRKGKKEYFGRGNAGNFGVHRDKNLITMSKKYIDITPIAGGNETIINGLVCGHAYRIG